MKTSSGLMFLTVKATVSLWHSNKSIYIVELVSGKEIIYSQFHISSYSYTVNENIIGAIKMQIMVLSIFLFLLYHTFKCLASFLYWFFILSHRSFQKTLILLSRYRTNLQYESKPKIILHFWGTNFTYLPVFIYTTLWI